MIAPLNLAFYLLFIISVSTHIEKGVKFWTTCYAVGGQIFVGAFLLIMARILLKMSRKQFTKRRDMPPTVKQILNFITVFTAAFTFLTIVDILGVVDTVRNEFNPT